MKNFSAFFSSRHFESLMCFVLLGFKLLLGIYVEGFCISFAFFFLFSSVCWKWRNGNSMNFRMTYVSLSNKFLNIYILVKLSHNQIFRINSKRSEALCVFVESTFFWGKCFRGIGALLISFIISRLRFRFENFRKTLNKTKKPIHNTNWIFLLFLSRWVLKFNAADIG